MVEEQDEIPDTPSAPWKLSVTGWLNQPLKSGGRSGCIPATTGADLSMPIQTGFEDVPPSAQRTLQVRCTRPSAVNVPFWHPESIVPPADQDHWSVTDGAVYQCSHPSRTVGVSHEWPTDCALVTDGTTSPAAIASSAAATTWGRRTCESVGGVLGGEGPGLGPKVERLYRAVNCPVWGTSRP